MLDCQQGSRPTNGYSEGRRYAPAVREMVKTRREPRAPHPCGAGMRGLQQPFQMRARAVDLGGGLRRRGQNGDAAGEGENMVFLKFCARPPLPEDKSMTTPAGERSEMLRSLHQSV